MPILPVSSAKLTVAGLTKTFQTPEGPVTALNGVDLTLSPGETMALTGESGSGKSTLLHIIAGLEPVDAGEIRLGDTNIGGLSDAGRAALRRERISVVFQQFNLVPSLSVIQNIRLQARLADRDDPVWTARLIEGLGLAGLETRFPEALSGGQQQRVAIARALAPRPTLLLADEPTGSLDEATGDQVASLATDMVRETGCMLLMATHNPRLAARLDRTAALRAGRVS